VPLCLLPAGGSLDLQSLCVLPGKTCWVVYVDALLLNDGGNVLDALSIATRAALTLTRIPKVRIRLAGLSLVLRHESITLQPVPPHHTLFNPLSAPHALHPVILSTPAMTSA
jgi:exosome complex RNA-binding protein Rrp42 (RNase PH superfamily)